MPSLPSFTDLFSMSNSDIAALVEALCSTISGRIAVTGYFTENIALMRQRLMDLEDIRDRVDGLLGQLDLQQRVIDQLRQENNYLSRVLAGGISKERDPL